MATKPLCSIPNCGKPAKHKGWCGPHYKRWWTYGDPLEGGTAWGEPMRYFRETVLPYDGDDCLFWPFGKTTAGYGELRIDGTMRHVHRLICEYANGVPPTPKHEAAHSCGNGHLGCAAKRHLSWKTSAENKADMIEHGTAPRGMRNGHAKLTDADVLIIRSLRGNAAQRDLARRFGVSQTTISDVQSGKVWSHLDR